MSELHVAEFVHRRLHESIYGNGVTTWQPLAPAWIACPSLDCPGLSTSSRARVPSFIRSRCARGHSTLHLSCSSVDRTLMLAADRLPHCPAAIHDRLRPLTKRQALLR